MPLVERMQHYVFPASINSTAILTVAELDLGFLIRFTATTSGTSGNAISITIVVAGNNTPFSVVVVGSAITINSATDAGGLALSTGLDVQNGIAASPAAAALVSTSNAAGGVLAFNFGPTN